LSQILDHVRREKPNEACGLIGGRADYKGETVIQIPNVARNPRVRFEMDHRAMVEAITTLQREGREVVAIYHSHPESPAEPSVRDITEATWPDALYIIVSLLGEPEIRVWSIRYGRAETASLTVSES